MFACQFSESEVGKPLTPAEMSAHFAQLFGESTGLGKGPALLENILFANVRIGYMKGVHGSMTPDRGS